jgi:uncharacterized protein YaiE (UPF0345 family)
MANVSKLEDVNVILKANVYFEGKVVSHSLELKDGTKQTVGLIYPGSFNFNTGAPERMDIIAGVCKVRLAGETEWKTYLTGTFFEVPAKSSFDIAVENGITEYLCTFK